MLASNGLLTECDLDTLAVYCSTWTTLAQSGYEQISPCVTIAKNTLADRIGDKLGLNPAPRSRIQLGSEDTGRGTTRLNRSLDQGGPFSQTIRAGAQRRRP